MRILVKILLSLAVLLIAVVFQSVLTETGNNKAPLIRLLPAAILIFGLIGVWRYKPSKSSTDKTDLDKTL